MQAIGFLDDMRPTFLFAGYSSTNASVSGWTSSERDGLPVAGGASYSHPVFNGSFGVGPNGTADQASQYRGVWLRRPGTDDLTPPVIRPTVSGTLGAGGWYVSNVSVSWDVQDPDSPVSSRTGCDVATVTADTAATTFTCEATSSGGTARVSAVVRRDTKPPVVTCASPVPSLRSTSSAPGSRRPFRTRPRDPPRRSRRGSPTRTHPERSRRP